MPPPPESPPPLGDKSAGILLSMFQDIYRQELTAEEDVHRTLPFFATALGLILAAINYAASQLPSWSALTKSCGAPSCTDWGWLVCGWPALLSEVFLAVAVLTSVGVLLFLALATKRRGYERAGPERVQLDRAQALQAYHRGLGLADAALDSAVVADLREQLLEDYTEVIPRNRSLTLQRYHLRALAVSFLLWSLFAAVAATILMMVTAKFGLMKVAP
jgi:hypothetical protein